MISSESESLFDQQEQRVGWLLIFIMVVTSALLVNVLLIGTPNKTKLLSGINLSPADRSADRE